MKRQMIFAGVCTAFVSTAAFAETPAYVSKLQHPLGDCKPSCYDKERSHSTDAQPKEVCGYIDYGFDSIQVNANHWSALKWLGESTAAPTPLAKCKLPADSGGAWGAFAKQARASYEPKDPKTMSFVVEPGAQWSYSVDDDRVKHRTLTVRAFATNYTIRPNECGSYDRVCEASGSKTALALNVIHYRLDEAKKAAETKNTVNCQIATFTAVATSRGIHKLRETRKKKKEWGEGVKYSTRFDGDLDEAGVFAKIEAYETEALALHVTCGGASPLITEVPRGHTNPETYALGNVD